MSKEPLGGSWKRKQERNNIAAPEGEGLKYTVDTVLEQLQGRSHSRQAS